MTPSELICLSGIALPPAIVPSRYIQGTGGETKNVARQIYGSINQIRPLGVKTGHYRQLTENIGVRALVSRCFEVVGMAKECTDMRQLRDKVARHYGRRMVQFTLSLPDPAPGSKS